LAQARTEAVSLPEREARREPRAVDEAPPRPTLRALPTQTAKESRSLAEFLLDRSTS
jgi:hypothetical protein